MTQVLRRCVKTCPANCTLPSIPQYIPYTCIIMHIDSTIDMTRPPCLLCCVVLCCVVCIIFCIVLCVLYFALYYVYYILHCIVYVSKMFHSPIVCCFSPCCIRNNMSECYIHICSREAMKLIYNLWIVHRIHLAVNVCIISLLFYIHCI